MDLTLTHDFSEADLAAMEDIYTRVGWKAHTPDVIRKVFMASTQIVIVRDEAHVVGFGRALSDGVYNAAIYDVVVDPDYQGRGVGRRIMADLLDRLRDVSCVHLVATTGKEAFYRRVGLRPMKTAMARYLRAELAAEYLTE
jgi:ribosomal protein S18 acetylase RimI-like enzyme